MSIAAAYRSPRRFHGRSLVAKLKSLIWGKGPVGDRNSSILDERWLAYGCSLVRLDKVGDGVPDRLVGMGTSRGRVDFFVEYKNPDGDHNYRKLRQSQELFMERWRGRKPQVVETVQDVDFLFAAMKEIG